MEVNFVFDSWKLFTTLQTMIESFAFIFIIFLSNRSEVAASVSQ